MRFLTLYKKSICVTGIVAGIVISFPSLTANLVRNKSRSFSPLPLLLKIRISIDQGVAAVPTCWPGLLASGRHTRVTMVRKHRK